MNIGRVSEFLMDVTCGSRPGKYLEARSAVAIAPGWGFDLLAFKLCLDSFHVDATFMQLVCQCWIKGYIVCHKSIHSCLIIRILSQFIIQSITFQRQQV